MMMAVDAAAARRLICEAQRGEAPEATCEMLLLEPDADRDANTVTNVELRNEPARRRRR
jgi:hypothetical protein